MMVGNIAKEVIFNYEGIQGKAYSRDMFNEWEGAMKGAINRDVIAEGIPNDEIRLEEAHRYGHACEEVIINLLFWCNLYYLPDNSMRDDNKA